MTERPRGVVTAVAVGGLMLAAALVLWWLAGRNGSPAGRGPTAPSTSLVSAPKAEPAPPAIIVPAPAASEPLVRTDSPPPPAPPKGDGPPALLVTLEQSCGAGAAEANSPLTFELAPLASDSPAFAAIASQSASLPPGGRCTLDKLAAGAYRWELRLDRIIVDAADIDLGQGTTLLALKAADYPRLAGRVRDGQGRNVAAAAVVLSVRDSVSGARVRLKATADEQGRVSFCTLPAHAVMAVEAVAPGFGTTRAEDLRFTRDQSALDIVVTLRPRCTLTGLVLGPGDAPVAQCSVVVTDVKNPYGPFSERVESDVEDLVFAGLVEERVMSLGFVGSDGHPGKRFQYVMTAEGKERFEELQDAYGSDIQQLRSFVERLVAAAGGLDQGILSAAAKTHFIVKHEKRPVSVAEIKTFGTKLGWNLERTQMKQVAKILTELQLAQVKN